MSTLTIVVARASRGTVGLHVGVPSGIAAIDRKRGSHTAALIAPAFGGVHH